MIECIGIGHQDGGTANHGDLGDGRGAGPRNHQMRRADTGSHVGEERRDLGLDAHFLEPRPDMRLVLGPGLLGEAQPRPERFGQQPDCRWNGVREELCALTAAKHHQAERLAIDRRDIGDRCRRDHFRAHRIAGDHGLVRIPALAFGQETAGNRLDPRGKRTVGAPHHRVLLVQHCRQTRIRRSKQRRDGRITAKTDDRVGPDLPDQCACLAHTLEQGPQRLDHLDRVLRADGGGPHDVNVGGGKLAGKTLRAAVGNQVDPVPARRQFVRQRLGRKQMSAGAAGRQQKELGLCHDPIPPPRSPQAGRSRAAAPCFPACAGSAPARSRRSPPLRSSRSRHRRSGAASCPWPEAVPG